MRFLLIALLTLSLNVHAQIIITNGLTHQIISTAGQSKKGEIILRNTANVESTARVFLEDYEYYVDGDTSDKTASRSNKSWIQLKEDIVSLQPNEEKTVEYTVQVPKNKSLNGSYWSVAIVQPADDIINPPKDKGAIHIRTVVRYAIQLITNVKTKMTTTSELSFLSAKVEKNQDKKELWIDVKNTGRIFHKAKLAVEFYDADSGEQKSVLSSNTLSLLPTLSKRYRVDITQIPRGAYKVVVLAQCENEELFGLNMDITIESD